jgi:hypothetical protein
MKAKILLIIMLFVFANNMFAQKQIVADFEEWTPLNGWPGVEEPLGWTSLNRFTAPLGKVSVKKSTQAYHGNYSVEIRPLASSSLNSTRVTYILNGAARIDSNTFQFDTLGWGVPRPSGFQRLWGYYRYAPDSMNQDSAYLFVLSRKGSERYFLGNIVFSANDTFSLFECWLSGFPAFEPDTLSIGVFYSTNDTSAQPKGRLWIDFLTSFNPNNTSETEKQIVQLYPNPVSRVLSLNATGLNKEVWVSVTNITGTQVLRKKLFFNQGKAELDFTGIERGFYIVSIDQFLPAKVVKMD